jgi:hypothetical protein
MFKQRFFRRAVNWCNRVEQLRNGTYSVKERLRSAWLVESFPMEARDLLRILLSNNSLHKRWKEETRNLLPLQWSSGGEAPLRESTF